LLAANPAFQGPLNSINFLRALGVRRFDMNQEQKTPSVNTGFDSATDAGKPAMPLKNVLVHLDDRPASAACVEFATALASQHDAHLTGLYVVGAPTLPESVLGLLPRNTLADNRAALLAQGERALQKFLDRAATQNLRADSRLQQGPDFEMPGIVALNARYSDIAILGQPAPETATALDWQVIEQTIFGSGRPVLIVPYIGGHPTVGDRIVVAWDTSRESTRALNDAMPILEKAKRVTVLLVNPRPGGRGHGPEPGADVALHLARHGVKVEVRRTEVRDIAVGEAILSMLADLSADLLVMGAYGHSHLREYLLGGVTRVMLKSMTVPVLMSH
jgi:nucleotide-binding universal stress UspA family protein